MKEHTFTLITGAGRGFGLAMARECARRGMDLLLTSLPGDDLPSLAQALHEEYGIATDSFETDLTAPEGPLSLYHWTQEKYYTVKRLINNAGLGAVGPFVSKDAAFYGRQIDINVRALVLLTRYFIDELSHIEGSRILNISSLAYLSPMPYKIVYSTTKGFIYGFSRSLRQEYLSTPLRVCVAIPGPMHTNANVTKRINDQGFMGRAIAWQPEKAARICIDGMLKGKALILPGFYEKFSFLMEKILPLNLKLKMIARSFRNNPPS